MGLTTDRNDPDLHVTEPSGMNKTYLVLSAEERAKGFVRPVRRSYRHVGIRPKYPTRPLTDEDRARFSEPCIYVAFEAYPDAQEYGPQGRFWSQAQLQSGCGAVTTMGLALCETYARDPSFYGSTFCCQCGKHLPVAEFTWVEDGATVGS